MIVVNNLLTVQPPVIAHRGASAYAPENTIAAFEAAVAAGVRWVEFDVMQAACGELIIFHDDTLDRTTSGKGAVIDHPYSYLRTLDAGSWFDTKFRSQYIPTLKEVLLFLQKNKLNANIEIKASPGHERIQVEKMIEVVSPFFCDQQTFLFSSFSTEALRVLHQKAPMNLIGLLIHDWAENWLEVCQWLNPISIHVNEAIMTAKHAKDIKGSGKQLFCYTVNDPVRAEVLFSWGVDAVFTDRADIIMNAISR